LYEFLQNVGKKLVRKNVLTSEEAEDLASDAYLKTKPSIRNAQSWKAYATCGFNFCMIDYFKRRTIERRVEADTTSPEEFYTEPDENLMLESCLNLLPESYKAVWLYDYCQYDLKDGAKLTGLTVSAYKCRLYRARGLIKKVLYNQSDQ